MMDSRERPPSVRGAAMTTPGAPPELEEAAGAGRADGRHRLTRDRIVDEAIALVDAEGVNALTMRRLGARLGVEAMALYRYVNGREDLLEGVVDRLVASLEIDPGTRMEPSDGWQAFLQWMAHNVRRLALDHPKAFPLVATRHPAAPWLRPPLRSIEVVNMFLDSLIGYGFSDEQAVGAYRSFTSFLLGQLLLESAARGAETGPVEEPLDEGGADIPEGDGQMGLEHA